MHASYDKELIRCLLICPSHHLDLHLSPVARHLNHGHNVSHPSQFQIWELYHPQGLVLSLGLVAPQVGIGDHHIFELVHPFLR